MCKKMWIKLTSREGHVLGFFTHIFHWNIPKESQHKRKQTGTSDDWITNLEKNISMSRDKCFYISIHYRFQNGPSIRMHAESRKRAIRAATVFRSHRQKMLTQQLLKGGKRSIKEMGGIVFLPVRTIQREFVKLPLVLHWKQNPSITSSF